MILILTGPVQSGKTRFLAGVVARLDRAKTGVSGFLSPGVYEGGRLIGYDLSVIGREKPMPFLRKLGDPAWERSGPYFFIPEALREARQTISDSRVRDLLVVDEVGPLELGGGGLWGSLEQVLAVPARRCLLVVRASCLEALLARLRGHTSKIFSVDEPSAGAALLFEIARDTPSPPVSADRDS